MEEMTKAEKRQLNQAAAKGHEEALRRALQKLDADFDLWRGAKIDSFELADRIHKFHQKEDREIYKRFVDRSPSDAHWVAIYCLNEGLIRKEDIPEQGLAYVNKVRNIMRQAGIG